MRIVKNLLALFLLALMAACSGRADTPLPPATQPGVPLPSTPLATNTQFAYTPPPTFTPAPSATPLRPDVLTKDELQQRLDPFSLADPACALPCYNGLIVGQSNLSDTLSFYAQLGIGPNDYIPGDYTDVQDGEGRLGAWLTKTTDIDQADLANQSSPLVDVTFEQGIARTLYVGWGNSPAYLTPASVLVNAGTPARVEIGFAVEQDTSIYVLALYYPTLQFATAFYGSVSDSDDARTICFGQDVIRRTYLMTHAADIPPLVGIPAYETLLPLEESLGISYGEFVEAVVNGECVITPTP